ncbi:MAG: asparagine synthase (glutamine-hydrolyzing) [Burkholderiaceae bacterium]
MCGITGFWSPSWEGGAQNAATVLERMARTLTPRGPDAMASWTDPLHGVALAHRRLSVVDLSPAGAQPMESPSSRFVITFNGEIYNHLRLRQELDVCWRGTSDTETLLAGFDVWGVRTTIERCIGMFAFAVWDRELRSLTLGRDRLGEKPLYYGWQAARASAPCLIFGSELKALRVHPTFEGRIDRDALSSYMRYGNVGSVMSIYAGIRKLPPASLLTLSAPDSTVSPQSYWSAADVVADAAARRFDGNASEAVETVESLLKDAVRQQMVADVPLGAFLSGGVDSSLIAALMQVQSDAPVKTFSIGFKEDEFDEARHARAVAQHLGTDHTELYLTADQALQHVPELPVIYDEPFADSSQLPTLLLSRMTRKHVTVALSGDGGDELFCGYNRYRITDATWHRLSCVPAAWRRGLAKAVLRLPPEAWDRVARGVAGVMPFARHWAHIGGKVHKGARVLASRDIADLYRGIVSHWHDPESIVIGSSDPVLPSIDTLPGLERLSNVERMMASDLVGYLIDDILVKIDRAAMSASLETRVPYLDHRVVELAWRLPMHLKLRGSETKWVLRQILWRYVPRTLIERPKAGFAVPIGQWLRGPLREWAEDLLSESTLEKHGYLRAAPIRERWADHLSGRQNCESALWAVLMFQTWLQSVQPTAVAGTT